MTEADAVGNNAVGNTDERRPSGREEIIEAVTAAAARLFSSGDPGQVSLRTIAAEAGVSYSLVHRHLETKGEVVRRALETMTELYRVDAATAADLPAEVILAGASQRYIDDAAHARTLAWTVLEGIEPAEVIADSPAVAALIDRVDARAGGLDGDVVAAMVLAQMMGWSLFRDVIGHMTGTEADDETVSNHLAVAIRAIMALGGEPVTQ